MCVKTYGKSWNTLKALHDGEKVWRDRTKELKLGYGSTGSTAAKGTCNKGGKWLKKGGDWSKAAGWKKEGQVQAFEAAGEGIPA